VRREASASVTRPDFLIYEAAAATSLSRRLRDGGLRGALAIQVDVGFEVLRPSDQSVGSSGPDVRSGAGAERETRGGRSILPRAAAVLLVGATAGFFFVFFVAEFLPPVAGQVGSAVFGGLLAAGFVWIGTALWQGAP
jgi:hypothetical protein